MRSKRSVQLAGFFDELDYVQVELTNMNSVIDQVSADSHRLTVAEYHRMAETGLLAPDARVELIEGAIVDMAPIGSRHGAKTSYLDRVLSRAAGDSAIVRVQLPINLGNMSEPQPDLALVKPRQDFYEQDNPSAADTLLIIEVSQTSLRFDHRVKVPLYASHGVPEVWLLDLQGGRLHCFRSPLPGGYADVSEIESPGAMSLAALPGVSVDLSGLI